MKRVSIWKLLVILVVGGYILSSTWYSLPFKGRVVDEAGEPVAGAVVGIGWKVSFFSPHPLVFEEAVTDNKGNYKISGWIRMTPSPMFRLVFSPHMYVVRQGFAPLKQRSRWISYDTNATPEFKQPTAIRRLNEANPEKELQNVDYLVSDICTEMDTFYNKNILSNVNILKAEAGKLRSELNGRLSKNRKGDACF